MGNELFEAFNHFLNKHYGRTASKETFIAFIKYCQRGVEENGVVPVVNPFNLYAYGMKIRSEEAIDLAITKPVQEV